LRTNTLHPFVNPMSMRRRFNAPSPDRCLTTTVWPTETSFNVFNFISLLIIPCGFMPSGTSASLRRFVKRTSCSFHTHSEILSCGSVTNILYRTAVHSPYADSFIFKSNHDTVCHRLVYCNARLLHLHNDVSADT